MLRSDLLGALRIARSDIAVLNPTAIDTEPYKGTRWRFVVALDDLEDEWFRTEVPFLHASAASKEHTNQ